MDKAIHIFRAGDWTDYKGRKVMVNEQQLQEIAQSYDPALFDAPVVVGHPKSNAPAYGWVKRLFTKGKGLYAELHKVDDTFKGLVKEGRYQKISASFFGPKSANNPANNPSEQKWYLKHVGFLGAAAPAVTGLEPVAFAAPSDEDYCFTQGISDLERHSIEERLQKLEERERSIWLNEQLETGRILPVERDFVAEFMQGLDNEDYCFASPDSDTAKLSQMEAFKWLFEKRPAIVNFAEVTATTGRNTDGDDYSFSAPRGYEANKDAVGLHTKACAFAEANDIGYSEAVLQVHAKAETYARKHGLEIGEAIEALPL